MLLYDICYFQVKTSDYFTRSEVTEQLKLHNAYKDGSYAMNREESKEESEEANSSDEEMEVSEDSDFELSLGTDTDDNGRKLSEIHDNSDLKIDENDELIKEIKEDKETGQHITINTDDFTHEYRLLTNYAFIITDKNDGRVLMLGLHE